MTLDLGFHKLPDADYFDLPLISKSGLDLIAKSPLAYKWAQTNPRTPTPAMELGTAVHMGVLEPERFLEAYVCLDECDRRTKEGKAAWTAAQLSGKKPVKAKDFVQIREMVSAVLANETARKFLSGGKAEVAAIGRLGPNGTLAKAKIDYLSDEAIVDLKTTSDASWDGFRSSVVNYRYHVQAALYLDVAQQIAPAAFRPRKFIFVVVETEAPYHTAVYEADLPSIAIGRRLYEKDLAVYDKCVAADNWPGLPEGVQGLTLPVWYTERYKAWMP